MTPDERHKKAMQMHEEGKTFQQIGDYFGVSATRGSELVRIGYRKARKLPHWTDGLPRGYSGKLVRMNFKSRQELEIAIANNEILRRNGECIGKVGMPIIRAWLTNNSTPSA